MLLLITEELRIWHNTLAEQIIGKYLLVLKNALGDKKI